ncbi:hypothetical protein [Haloprofundus halobius]|uniref:hypothetical protein n=1 Tax=Haloprofundus halobius TaxID=2876194 RepID=UPI001CC95109|nr:hypothetical protein [Haloprofundus halobius]
MVLGVDAEISRYEGSGWTYPDRIQSAVDHLPGTTPTFVRLHSVRGVSVVTGRLTGTAEHSADSVAML